MAAVGEREREEFVGGAVGVKRKYKRKGGERREKRAFGRLIMGQVCMQTLHRRPGLSPKS
jgi:hypothetical protein